MAVPDEILHRLSRWCAERVPGSEREHRQLSFTVQGTDVTIHDRRRPEYPELATAWSSTAIARLRQDAEDRWTLYQPVDGEWHQQGEPGADPIALLNRLN